MACARPPDDFASLALPAKIFLPGKTPFLRIHRSQFSAMYFNSPKAGPAGDGSRYRFDAPEQEYGVLYAARSFDVCFCETILRDKVIGVSGIAPAMLNRNLIDERSVSEIICAAPLKLVDFVNKLPACRVDSSISSEFPYTTPNLWGLAVHAHPAGFDGIYYRSRFTGNPAVALFDRAQTKIKLLGDAVPLSKCKVLKLTLKKYKLGLYEASAGALVR